jgi:hypothetical protein
MYSQLNIQEAFTMFTCDLIGLLSELTFQQESVGLIVGKLRNLIVV